MAQHVAGRAECRLVMRACFNRSGGTGLVRVTDWADVAIKT